MHPGTYRDERTAGAVTQRSPFALWGAFVLLLVFVSYMLLVAADYVLARRLSAAQEQVVSEPEAIERRRQREEDEPQREAAREQGHKALIFPDVVERYPQLMDLAAKLKVAPLAPHPNSRLYYCNEGYGLITYLSDRFGFRNPDKNWDESIKYVLIGDSFTQGACVPDDKNIAGIMGKSATTLNLGVGGDNPIHYAATAKLFIPKIKPEFAVMVFYANDNDAGNRDSIYFQYYLRDESVRYFQDDRSGKLALAGSIEKFYVESEPLVRSIISENGANISDSTFFQRGNVLARAAQYLSLPTIRSTFGLVRSSLMSDASLPFSSRLAIDTLVAACKNAGCQPVVTYIPNSEFWRPDPRSNRYAKLLSEYSMESKVIFFDNTTSIRAMGENAYAKKGAHLSPEGYETVARNLLGLFSRQRAH